MSIIFAERERAREATEVQIFKSFSYCTNTETLDLEPCRPPAHNNFSSVGRKQGNP